MIAMPPAPILGVSRAAHRVVAAHRRLAGVERRTVVRNDPRTVVKTVVSLGRRRAGVSACVSGRERCPKGIRTPATALKGRSLLGRSPSSLEGKPSVDVRRCLPRAALTVVKTVVSPSVGDPLSGGPTVVTCAGPPVLAHAPENMSRDRLADARTRQVMRRSDRQRRREPFRCGT